MSAGTSAKMTDDMRQARAEIDKFIEVAKTMMARRHVQASEAYLNALRELLVERGKVLPAEGAASTAGRPKPIDPR